MAEKKLHTSRKAVFYRLLADQMIFQLRQQMVCWYISYSVFSVCFGVYSMRGEDGYITREEMYILLKNCLVQVRKFTS